MIWVSSNLIPEVLGVESRLANGAVLEHPRDRFAVNSDPTQFKAQATHLKLQTPEVKRLYASLAVAHCSSHNSVI